MLSTIKAQLGVLDNVVYGEGRCYYWVNDREIFGFIFNMDTHEIWQSVLGEIELQISRPNFLTWLKQSALIGKDEKEGVALVSLPNNFAKEWVQGRYHKMILGSLRARDGSIKSVKYTVVGGQDGKDSGRKVKENGQAFQETLLAQRVDEKTKLNPRYTFESFIVGGSNELAFAAAQAVVEKIGIKYNPLFIYGGVGLGKTHLIQATGNAIKNKYGGKVAVLYVASEKFINDVVWAVRNKRMDDVKKRYRDVDVLIIDDIQFIGGKPTTELEFFYTFNTLHENNKQIIISSDRPPAAIPTLEERLRSRFEGGMIADVSYPDYEVRLAILRTKAQIQGIEVDDDLLQKIAFRVQKNVRELEGVLNKVIFIKEQKGEEVTDKRLDEIVGEVSRVSAKTITVAELVKAVAEFFDVPPNTITDRSRKKAVVEPRQVCMYLMRELLNLSYPSIGEKLGKRDHTTAIHAHDKISRLLNKDAELNRRIMMIRERLQLG